MSVISCYAYLFFQYYMVENWFYLADINQFLSHTGKDTKDNYRFDESSEDNTLRKKSCSRWFTISYLFVINFYLTTGEEEDQMEEEGEGDESADLDVSADQSENKRKSANNEDIDDDLDQSEAKRTKQSESDE